MNKLATIPDSADIAPLENNVLIACMEAVNHGKIYSIKALIAGQLLSEHRVAMMTSHAEKSSKWKDKTKPESDHFGKWLATKCAGISPATAYRWMDIAGRVARLQLNLGTAEAVPAYIDVGGEAVPLSQALTAPEKDLGKAAIKFRQDVFDFMADKSLTEALAACVDGESDPKRITLAAGGKKHGGSKGENRKDFPLFISKNMLALNGNLKGWEKWRAKQPAQFTEVSAILQAFIMGGAVPTDRNGATAKVNGWPRSLCELMADLLKERLKKERDAR